MYNRCFNRKVWGLEFSKWKAVTCILFSDFTIYLSPVFKSSTWYFNCKIGLAGRSATACSFLLQKMILLARIRWFEISCFFPLTVMFVLSNLNNYIMHTLGCYCIVWNSIGSYQISTMYAGTCEIRLLWLCICRGWPKKKKKSSELTNAKWMCTSTTDFLHVH